MNLEEMIFGEKHEFGFGTVPWYGNMHQEIELEIENQPSGKIDKFNRIMFTLPFSSLVTSLINNTNVHRQNNNNN